MGLIKIDEIKLVNLSISDSWGRQQQTHICVPKEENQMASRYNSRKLSQNKRRQIYKLRGHNESKENLA